MSDDLVTWLRAQLDEDERLARATLADNIFGRWHTETAAGYLHEAVTDEGGVRLATGPDRINAHIARHDPARVLREVEAKRRRLERHQPRIYDDGSASCDHCEETGDERWPCDELRLDLAVYADRPGCRDEWRP